MSVQCFTEAEALKQLTYQIDQIKIKGQDATKEILMGKLLSGQLLINIKVAGGCL